jgi:pimeloyl-ACP methyl ester carboxylesterase
VIEGRLEETNVHFESFGEGRHVVFLHGWLLDHRVMVSSMEPIFERRDGWQRIYPDLPGMGQTRGEDWISNQDQVLDVVVKFIDEVVQGERFAVVGYSYGGYLARGVVFRMSTQIDGVALIAPDYEVEKGDSPLPPHVTLVSNPDLLSELTPAASVAFEQLAVVQSRELLESLQTVGMPPREIADHKFLSRLSEDYEFSFDVDTPPAPYGGPSLMVMGRQDSVTGYRAAWRILENYPRSTFAVLDRAGHGLMIEQRDMFNGLMNEWIDRMEEHTASA